ncbi:MAG: MgtC/SapB family protein [Thermoleophilia bacterium]
MPELATADILVRVLLAAGLGALVGLERQWRNHVAGVRTHALVASGAALFTLAGAYGFPELVRSDNVDPMRVAAQVASGIGFVGAGAILRHGATVRGLTTAASLWAAAALGVAAGSGFLAGALLGFAVVLAALVALRWARGWTRVAASGRLGRRVASLVERDQQLLLRVAYERGRGTLGFLLGELERAGEQAVAVTIDDHGERTEPGVREVELRVRVHERAKLVALAGRLSELDEVVAVELLDEGDEEEPLVALTLGGRHGDARAA